MPKNSLKILFSGFNINENRLNLHENGNLLFITRIILTENGKKNIEEIKKLLETLEIKRDVALLIRDIDELLLDNLTKYSKELKKKSDGLDNMPYLRPYLALFWEYKAILKSFKIDLDSIFEKNRESIGIDFFNKLPKINSNIVLSIIKFHFLCLELKNKEKDEKKKYDNDFYENNSLTVLRAVEILVNLQFLNSSYIDNLYFDNNDELITNFISIINGNRSEALSYVIKNNNKKCNYIHYKNFRYTNLEFIINSMRVIKKGKSRKEEVNENLIVFFKSALYSYTKLLNLKLKSEYIDTNLHKNFSKYTLQDTQIEPVLEFTKKISNQTNVECKKDEKIEIFSKSRLSKRVTSKTSEELEDEKTIENTDEDVSNSFKQLKQNRAYSALITKDRLLLANNYNIPEINIYKEFIQHVANKPFSNTIITEDVFNSIFLISVQTGFNYNDILHIFLDKNSNKIYQTKTGVVELDLHSNAVTIIKDNVFFQNPNKKINYLIPGLFVNLIDKIRNELISGVIDSKELSEEEYKSHIKNKIVSFPKTITFDYSKTWYFLIAFVRSHLKEDITSLFSMSKNFQNDESKLAYGSTAKGSIIYSNFLKEIYEKLELDSTISRLYDWTNYKKKFSIDNHKEVRVGSNRAIAPQKVKDFFYLLNQRIEYSNNKIERFNLLSIYTRIALGILLGTRTFSYSCSLSRISFTFHILSISEKANTQLSGIRQIPLCAQAENIIKKYQKESIALNVPKDDIYLVNSIGDHYLYNIDNAEIEKIVKSLKLDSYLMDFLHSVPLNTGRHIISKHAVEENLNGYYLETFLGHFVSGAEQFGTFSNLNFKNYIDTMRKFLSNIANIYGIY